MSKYDKQDILEMCWSGGITNITEPLQTATDLIWVLYVHDMM